MGAKPETSAKRSREVAIAEPLDVAPECRRSACALVERHPVKYHRLARSIPVFVIKPTAEKAVVVFEVISRTWELFPRIKARVKADKDKIQA
jgi:hypothetical protein